MDDMLLKDLIFFLKCVAADLSGGAEKKADILKFLN